MDFELSDDQEALRGAARELLDGRCDRTVVRSALDGAGFHTGLWQAMVAQGWLGLGVAESDGGLGLGTVELAVLLEQTGDHLAPVPFLQQVLTLSVLADSTWSPDLLSGELIGSAARRPVTLHDDGTASGRPEPVIFGASADVLVVPAISSPVDADHVGRSHSSTGPDEPHGADRAGPPDPSSTSTGSGSGSDGVLVAVDLRGVPVTAEPAMDQTRELAWVDLDHAPAEVVGDATDVAAFLDRGATFHAVEMLGGADAVLRMAVEYAKEREQFGRPIGSFQAVKHRCADMLVDVEGMRSAAYYAAWAIGADDQGDESSVAASTAKVWCSDAGLRVAESALQVHGGIGFTWESDVHLHLKRAQLDQVSFGDAPHHRGRLTDLLRARLAAGADLI